MDEASAANVLGKLRLLEQRMPELAHKPMAPFPVRGSDPLDLQEAAKKLAAHVGLGDLTFIVAIAKQSKGVGGHVELHYAQREVFIELDEQLIPFPECTLAALAHEVTHKLLHHHNIWIEPALENERLTDIAAVYAGFGAIMLIGCESENVSEQGGVRTLSKLRGGYLDRNELGLTLAALEFLGEGRNGRRNLFGDAADAVIRGENFLASLWPREKRGQDEMVESIRDSIRSEQAALASIEKDLVYLRDHALPSLQEQAKDAHRRLCRALGELRALEAGEGGRADILRAVSLELDARQSKRQVSRSSMVTKTRKATQKAVKAIEPVDAVPNRTTDMFRLITCPIDGAKLRIPADKKRIAVRCPKCNYKFIADSTLDSPDVKAKKSGWFRR